MLCAILNGGAVFMQTEVCNLHLCNDICLVFNLKLFESFNKYMHQVFPRLDEVQLIVMIEQA